MLTPPASTPRQNCAPRLPLLAVSHGGFASLHDPSRPEPKFLLRALVLEVDRDGRRLLIAFFRLEVVGWYCVVEADAAKVDSRKEPLR